MRTQRARARLYADGTAVVGTAAQEFGTGMTTVLTQVAADALGLGLDDVRLDYGDTDLPTAGSPVGSNGAMMVSAAVHHATGHRVHELPITVEDLLPALEWEAAR